MIADVVCPPGDQVNVPPTIDGVPVRVVLEPLQMVAELTFTVGKGFTVTAEVAVAVQPERS